MSEIEFNKQLTAAETPIEGLVVYDLPVFGDNRGWFKENWQRQKMLSIGLPDFGPVQNNFSFNDKRGVARGIHAEPWDKYVSLGSGRIFGFWVDIREGSSTYGKSFTTQLDPSKAIFVPRGVANGYQTLEDNTVYSYLVNDHWSADAQYSFVSMFDTSLGIEWPIPIEESEVSDKDKAHPLLVDAVPITAKKKLIVGANGQVGTALQAIFPEAVAVDRTRLDISNREAVLAYDWSSFDTILNAAGYTNVDEAETERGRVLAWQANAVAVQNLSEVANLHNLTLVHVSSDYVFDGTNELHTEDEPYSPLGVYAQSKVAGDIAATLARQHYLLRVSWVIGSGKNFVRSIAGLASRNISPAVVADQFGRVTFTTEIARAVNHLLLQKAPYGTYNVSNDGDIVSWADVAREVYKCLGRNDLTVTDTTAEEYFAGKVSSPRPVHSGLELAKIKAVGFAPKGWRENLTDYLQTLDEE